MATGKAITLTRIGNGALGVQIDEAALDTLARDGQAPQANGTQPVSPAQAVLRAAVNDKGLIEAATLTEQGSLIVAEARARRSLPAACWTPARMPAMPARSSCTARRWP